MKKKGKPQKRSITLQIHHSLRVLTAGAYEETKMVINTEGHSEATCKALVTILANCSSLVLADVLISFFFHHKLSNCLTAGE